MNPADHFPPVSQWLAKLRPAAGFLAAAFALLRYGGNERPENAKRDALALAAHLSDYWRPKELGEAINVAMGGGRASPRSNIITQGLGRSGKREGLAGLGLFIRDPPDGRSPYRIVLTAKGKTVVDAGERQNKASAPTAPLHDDAPALDRLELRQLLEGEKRLAEYWRRMRRPEVARVFKSQRSSPVCSACDVDFEQMYGALGRNVIQAHDKESIGSRKRGTPTTIHDFDAVCANCHCVMHQHAPPLTVDQLRDLLSERRSGKRRAARS